MTKVRYLKHPINPTALGRKVLLCRLSLRETQPEFARRFKVSHMTIHKWETGKVVNVHRIYQHVLDALYNSLKSQGHLLAEEILETIMRTEFENKGNAIR